MREKDDESTGNEELDQMDSNPTQTPYFFNPKEKKK